MKFRTKIVVGFVLFQTILLAAAVYVGASFFIGESTSALIERAKNSARFVSATVKQAVIESDRVLLDQLVEQVVHESETGYLVVFDSHGDVLAMAGEPNVLEREELNAANIDSLSENSVVIVTREIQDQGTVHGYMDMYVVTDQVFGMTERIREYLAYVLAVAGALTIVFALMFGTYVTRRWYTIRDAAERVSKGNLDTAIPVTGADEIAETAMAFNKMSLELSGLYKRLNARESYLKCHYRECGRGYLHVERCRNGAVH